MEIAALSLLVCFSVLGFLLIFFTSFGTMVILIGMAAFAVMTQFQILDLFWLIIIFLLYLFGELLEFLLTAVGAKKMGGSNNAVVGAMIGGVAGAILGSGGLFIGALIGSVLGIFIGAFLFEYVLHRNLKKSLKAATGGVVGRVSSIAAKVIVALLMIVICFLRVIA